MRPSSWAALRARAACVLAPLHQLHQRHSCPPCAASHLAAPASCPHAAACVPPPSHCPPAFLSARLPDAVPGVSRQGRGAARARGGRHGARTLAFWRLGCCVCASRQRAVTLQAHQPEPVRARTPHTAFGHACSCMHTLRAACPPPSLVLPQKLTSHCRRITSRRAALPTLSKMRVRARCLPGAREQVA